MAYEVQVMGLRQPRYVGLTKVLLQHLLTAVALNVVRMVVWLQGTFHDQGLLALNPSRD